MSGIAFNANAIPILACQIGLEPPEKPMYMPISFTFPDAGIYPFDLTQYTDFASMNISMIQGIFIDNGYDANALTITAQIGGQRLIVKGNTQAWLPFMLPDPCVFTMQKSAAGFATVFLCNFPVPAAVWATA